jgi:hypothetical protein
MEHLVVGLFQKRGGPAQLVFADAGIDATALRELIARASKEEIDPSTHYDSTRLTVLPVISRHVREALIAASSAAGPDASSPIRSRHLLYGVLSVTDCELVKALAQRRGITRASVELDYPEPSTAGVEAAAEPDVTLPFVPSFPGFAGDLPSDEDHLGFKGDVEAFARLLAAKQVAPPLSVGLFGDWGTGKSTFMGLLRTRIREIAGQAAMAEQERRTDRSLPRPDCCANVRQITFNAWHYVDVNLWASLVTRIFEGLAEPEEDDPNATKQQQEQQREQREQQRREIFKQLDTAKELEQEATRRRDDAEQQLRQATEQLRSLERHRQSEEQALQERAATDLSPPDVGDLVAGAQAAATAAGLPDVPATIEGLQRQADRLRFIGDRVELAWQQARIAPRTRRVLNMAIVLAVLLFLTGLGLLVAGLLPGLPVLVASIVPIASAWITAIGKALRRVDLASARVEQALRDAEQRRLQAAREDAQRRAAAEARLQASIERLRQDEARQREEASRARRQRDTALRELEDIQAGRRLFRYIADRARGGRVPPIPRSDRLDPSRLRAAFSAAAGGGAGRR